MLSAATALTFDNVNLPAGAFVNGVTVDLCAADLLGEWLYEIEMECEASPQVFDWATQLWTCAAAVNSAPG